MAISNSTDRFNGVVASKAIKVRCVLAAEANVAALTGISNPYEGVFLVENDRILLTAQTNPIENGIWCVNDSPNGWTRAADWDGSRDVELGSTVWAGRQLGNDKLWQLTAPAGVIQPGTTAVTVSELVDPDAGTATDLQSTTDVGNTTTNDIQINRAAANVTALNITNSGRIVVENTVGDGDINIGSPASDTGQISCNGVINRFQFTGIDNEFRILGGGGITLQERNTQPTAALAGFGYLWLRDDTPNVLMFTDDTGVDFVLSSGAVLPAPTPNGATMYVAGLSWIANDRVQQTFTDLRIYEATITDYLYLTHSGLAANIGLSNAAHTIDIENDTRIRLGSTLSVIDTLGTSGGGLTATAGLLTLSEIGASALDVDGFTTIDLTADTLINFGIGANNAMSIQNNIVNVNTDSGGYLNIRDDIGSYTRLTSGSDGLNFISDAVVGGDPDRYLFQPVPGGEGLAFMLAERAAARADIAGYGQLWIRDDSPNVLMFTDDAGTDFVVNAPPMTFGEYMGVFDASGGAFPAAVNMGDWYNTTVAGTVDGQSFVVGDILIALIDAPSTATYAGNWTTVPHVGIAISGTPANNQIGVWTSASALEGESELTYNGGELQLAASQGRITIDETDGGGACSLFLTSTTTSDSGIVIEMDSSTGTDARIRQATSGGTLQDTWIAFAKDGAVTLYHNNVARLATSGVGVAVTGDIFDLNAGIDTTTSSFIRNSIGSMTFNVLSTTGNAEIRQSSNTGASQDLWIGLTRDGPVTLHHNNVAMARTAVAGSGGFEVNNTLTGAGFERVLTTSDLAAPLFAATGFEIRSAGNTDAEARILEFTHQDSTRRGFIGHNGATRFDVVNEIHGANILIGSEDIGGTLRVVINADPDSATEIRGDTDLNMTAAAGTVAMVLSAAGILTIPGQITSAADIVINAAANQDILMQEAGATRFQIDNATSRFVWNDYTHYIEERGAAQADSAGYGQLWVRNDTPNVLMFTGDDGVDHQITPIAAGGITQLTGDVTAGPGSGSQAATIANDAVTNLKLNNMAANTVKVRTNTGAGDPQDLLIGTNEVLGNFGGSLGVGQVTTAQLTNDNVTYAKMQNITAASRLLGRGSAGGAGDPEEITLGANLTMTGTVLAATGGAGIGGTIANDQVALGAATADEIEGVATLTFNQTTRQLDIGTTTLQGRLELHDQGVAVWRNDADGDSGTISHLGSIFRVDADVSSLHLWSTSDIELRVDDGQNIEFTDGTGSGIWSWDSATRISFSESIRVPDNEGFFCGTGADFNMNFDGADMQMTVSGASAELQLRVNAGENAIVCTPNAAVDLYHNNVAMARTATAANGAFEINNTDTGGGFERALTESDLGFSEINTQNGNYTLLIGDMGKTIYKSAGGAGETITIPANASVAYPIGTMISFDNDGGGDLSIAITTDVLVGTDGTTGTKTLGDNHTAVIQKLTATRWRYAASDL